MRLLTIHFEKPVTNPSKLGGVHQTTFSAPVDIQVHESGRVTLTAPDGTVAIVHGVGFHGVPVKPPVYEMAEVAPGVFAEVGSIEAQVFGAAEPPAPETKKRKGKPA